VQLRQLALVPHGAAQLVRLAGGEAAQRHGDGHGLLLEDGHAVRAAQDRLEDGVGVVHGSRPRRRSVYGWTKRAWMGPGRISATCTTMS
jgi:hypothetical protein